MAALIWKASERLGLTLPSEEPSVDPDLSCLPSQKGSPLTRQPHSSRDDPCQNFPSFRQFSLPRSCPDWKVSERLGFAIPSDEPSVDLDFSCLLSQKRSPLIRQPCFSGGNPCQNFSVVIPYDTRRLSDHEMPPGSVLWSWNDSPCPQSGVSLAPNDPSVLDECLGLEMTHWFLWGGLGLVLNDPFRS